MIKVTINGIKCITDTVSVTNVVIVYITLIAKFTNFLNAFSS